VIRTLLKLGNGCELIIIIIIIIARVGAASRPHITNKNQTRQARYV
jgi:hypothetical protein